MEGDVCVRASEARADRTEVWIPRGGVSALSVKGAPFEDPEADEALFRAVKDGLDTDNAGARGGREGKISVVERDEDINDPRFVAGMVGSLVKLMRLEPSKQVEAASG